MCPYGPCFCSCFLLLSVGHSLRECQGFSALSPLSVGHLSHVEQYEVVKPLQLPISGAVNEHSSSPTLYPETIRYLLGLKGNNFTLHLRRNRHLVSSDYTETHTLANGTEVTEKPQVGQHCYYQGHVEGHENSAASISICQGIRGFFKTGSTIHLIEPLDQEKHGDPQERQGIAQKSHGSSQEKHGGPQERQGIAQKSHGSSQEKHGGPQERQGITQKIHGSSQEKHGSPQKEHSSPHEKHIYPQEKHDIPHQRQNYPQEKHGRPQDRHSSTDKGYDSDPEKNHGKARALGKHVSDQDQNGSTQARQSNTSRRHVSHQQKHGASKEKHMDFLPKEKRYGSQEGWHAIYRQQDLKERQRTCGVSKVSLKGELETMMDAISLPHSWIPDSIPKDMHYVELFVVVDHTEYKKYKSLRKVRERVKEIVNYVDRLYQEINFRVILIGLEIWDKKDKAEIVSNVESTLSNFLQWRNSYLLKKQKHDNAQLITGVSFEGTIVGSARLASMCTESSGGVNQDYSTSPFEVATTLAHEMGHNLGMDHDENVRGCQCENKNELSWCIMTSVAIGALPKQFSSCSKYNLQKFLEGSIFSSSCLNGYPGLEKPKGKSVCGNKLLEHGEECDCGVPEECFNDCCNAKTCRLAPGAQCTDGECCQACQVMPAGEVCREAQNACDLAEYCDGKHAKCPENVFKENGSPCWEGYCYNGACPTYRQQCQALWGVGAKVSPDKCFLLKMPKGCSEAYYPSREGLNKCEFLHCSRPSIKKSNRHLCSYLLENERCDLAITKSESHSPFYLVAPGTKCGQKKVCQQGQCQDLSIYGTKNCSSKCNDRGICNHRQECHCDPGWAPPDCQKKYLEELPDIQRMSLGERPRMPLTIRSRNVLVGVLVALGLLVVLAVLVFVLCKCQMGRKEVITAGPPLYSYRKGAIGPP